MGRQVTEGVRDMEMSNQQVRSMREEELGNLSLLIGMVVCQGMRSPAPVEASKHFILAPGAEMKRWRLAPTLLDLGSAMTFLRLFVL